MSESSFSEAESGRPVVFRGGTVLTMDDHKTVLEGADVLIVGERIAAVGPALPVPTARSRSTRPAASSCRAWSTPIGTCGRPRCGGTARTGL